MAARKLRKPNLEDTVESGSTKKKEPCVTISLLLPRTMIIGLKAVAANENCGISEFAGQKLKQALSRYDVYKVLMTQIDKSQIENETAA